MAESIKNKIMKLDRFSLLVSANEVKYAESVEIIETDKSIIWLINPNKMPIDIKKLELIDNNNTHTFEIDGIWSAVIKNKFNNELKIIVSPLNEICWYYIKDKGIASTNIFLLFDYLDKIELDHLSIASFLAFDFVYGDETHIQGINKTYGGDVLYISKTVKVIPINLQRWLGFDRTISKNNILVDFIIEETKKYITKGKIEVTLTGGSDSRAILGLVNNLTNDYQLMIGSASTVDRRDIKIAKKIANILNKKISLVDSSRRTLKDIEASFNEVLLITSGLFIPRNYILFYKEFLMEKISESNLVRFMGYRGEYFKGFYSDIYKTVKKKTAIFNEHLRKNLTDKVLDLYWQYSKLDSLNAKELFYHRERDNFWVSSNIRAYMQNGLRVITPFGYSGLLSLGYRFNKGLKNTNLHNNLIKLLNPEVASIRTSPLKIFHYTKKILYLFTNKNNYDFFITPECLQKSCESEISDFYFGNKNMKTMLSLYEKFGRYDSILHKYFAVVKFRDLTQGKIFDEN